MKNLSNLLTDAFKIDPDGFLGLINQINQLLSEEKVESDKTRIIGRLIQIPPIGEATVIGDLHGDIESLMHILEESRFIEKSYKGEEVLLIFLGDYGDRGPYSPEVYHVTLSLKEIFPERVILLQGNHEGPEDLLAYPHDLPYDFQKKFGSQGREIYEELSRLFRRFYMAVIIDRKFLMLHGGAPSKAANLEDIAYAYEKHPAESHLEEILWSDPRENIRGTYPSPRGAGRLFGEDVTERLLKISNVRILIRGHEPSNDGYKINHSGKILTLFSRKGAPYYNLKGAYLHLDLSMNIDYMRQLEPSIRQF